MKFRKAPARKPVLKYALASIVIAAVALFVVLPVLLTTERNRILSNYKPVFEIIGYSSMQQYFDDNSIELKTFVIAPGENPQNPYAGGETTAIKKNYIPVECRLIEVNETIVIIEEDYSLVENIKLFTISILLIDDAVVQEEYYCDYTNLNKNAQISNIDIKLSYDLDTSNGMGVFRFANYLIYIKGVANTENEFLSFCQDWILKQS